MNSNSFFKAYSFWVHISSKSFAFCSLCFVLIQDSVHNNQLQTFHKVINMALVNLFTINYFIQKGYFSLSLYSICVHSLFGLELLNDHLSSGKYLYPWTCIRQWNPRIYINSAQLITTKQSNIKSFFQKHVL